MSETVYRIQNSEGRGPWKPGFSHRWVEARGDHMFLRPWYVEFGRVDRHLLTFEYAGSGCKTIAQLRRWFTPKEYETLKGLGYHAVKMEVSRIIAASNIQCIFARLKPLNEDTERIELYENPELL